jgi:hypothetical protein
LPCLKKDSWFEREEVEVQNQVGKTTMKKLDEMLVQAQAKRSWGEIIITLKDGKPILLKQTIQEKIEDYPANDKRN